MTAWFGWPGRVRSTGRVATRQEAAPCWFNAILVPRLAVVRNRSFSLERLQRKADEIPICDLALADMVS
jgi:hypothetical protein